MNVYCLYFPNGKRYVGIESHSGQRIKFHSRGYGMRSKNKIQPVSHAIEKYGWENVKWRYLFSNTSAEEGAKIEITMIRLFKTQSPEHGYNISPGGDLGQLGTKRSAETKALQSKAMKGCVHSVEKRAKISATLMGHSVSEATKAKILATKIANGWRRKDKHPKKTDGDGRFGRGGKAPCKGRVVCKDKDGHKRMARPEDVELLGWERATFSYAKPRLRGYKRPIEVVEKAKATRKTRYPNGCHQNRIPLPAGPNGETRYFRAEQLI